MNKEQFNAFMLELAVVMTENSTQPADEPMYRAMREWLRKKLVTQN